jgi:FlaA1/EpsC-like NDP-sugar epimerase
MDNHNFQIESFVSTLTGRTESLFANDIAENADELRNKIEGKSALVIGGAGTIGSSFVKAITEFKPARLLIVDINENGLTEVVRDLRSTADQFIPADLRLYPIDLGDRVFERLLKNEGPFDVVANFAAHKHVRSEKDHYSIEAMLDNNVVRAHGLLEQLSSMPPQHFFCVSTDKATNPVNVMGASKSLMERIIMGYASRFPVNTARFANVAFSNGSLLDGFLRRLQKRQPLSAPSDVRRYFVSPKESGQICLLACILGKSAEIFFPRLDQTKDTLTFSEIGVRLLKQLGLEADPYDTEEEARQAAASFGTSNKYPVYFFKTDTTGEKPMEEFVSATESVSYDRFQSLGVIQYEGSSTAEEAGEIVATLNKYFEDDDVKKHQLIDVLKSLLPDFAHTETGKNLDQKM